MGEDECVRRYRWEGKSRQGGILMGGFVSPSGSRKIPPGKIWSMKLDHCGQKARGVAADKTENREQPKGCSGGVKERKKKKKDQEVGEGY